MRAAPFLSPGATFHTRLGCAEVHRLFGRGKSGYSYLVHLSTESCVLKQMHDETVPYYTFGANKVELEVQAYQHLTALGVNVPLLLDHDPERNYLLKPFVDGVVASELIARGSLPRGVIPKLMDGSARLPGQGFNLDWFPSNFVITLGETVYIDYEINAYDERWFGGVPASVAHTAGDQEDL